ncbi:MAG: hypothetical protein MUQ27_01525 [Acidimicrobiia bacterium]|nr:hypothetical protein [Acidimicrobiia bacterium]
MKHRTAIVTAASVMVVILAATAAIATNLGILTGGTDTGEVGTLTVAANPAPDVPGAQVTNTNDPQSETATDSDVSIAPSTTTPAGEISAYEVGDAGVVTLESDGSTLTVVDVAPRLGWQTAQIPAGTTVEVGFVGRDGTVLLFAAEIDATGTIQTIVQDLSAAPAGGNTARSHDDDDENGSGDDDD